MTEQATTGADRESLRRQFLAHAGAAFDLLFHPDHQADLVTFEQRELRTVELMRDLGAWALQRQANSDPAAEPAGDQPVCCPRCGKPAGRVVRPRGAALPGRSLVTLTGEVRLDREQFRCTACRVVFFPPRP